MLTPENRFNGDIIRFPLLGKIGNIYRSGIIGSVNIGTGGEIGSANRSGYQEELKKLGENLNIYFVIEATNEIQQYQATIATSMRELKRSLQDIKQVKYGALLYSDVKEGDRLIKQISLTPDNHKVANFIGQADFINTADQDKYTAMYQGIEEAVKQAEFDPTETNVMIVIGNYGDFKADKDRRNHSQYTGSRLAKIYQSIAEFNTHFYVIQLKRNDTRENRAFDAQAHYLMLESAKYAYNVDVSQSTGELKAEMQGNTPDLPESRSSHKVSLKNCRRPGAIISSPSKTVSKAELGNLIKGITSKTIDFTKELEVLINKIMNSGQSVDDVFKDSDFSHSAGKLGHAALEILSRIPKESIDQGTYKVFKEVYFPHTIQGAKYPAISYVLLMPEIDLLNYASVIERALSIGSDFTKKREQLYEIYKELVVQYSGETGLRGRKPEDVSNLELMTVMQGVYDEGLTLNNSPGSCSIDEFKIGEIRNEKKMSSQAVEARLQRFYEIKEHLNNILRLGTDYPYCYARDDANRYYWVYLCDAF